MLSRSRSVILTRTVRLSGLCLALLLAFPQECLAQQQDLQETEALHRQVVQLYNQGRYAAAIPLAQNVLAIREKALGPEHPDVANSLHNLAGLYIAINDPQQAPGLFKRAQTIESKLIDAVLGFTSEEPHSSRSRTSTPVLMSSLM